MGFNQSEFSVHEDDGLAKIVLILSNPLLTDITILVRDSNGSATGKYIQFIKETISLLLAQLDLLLKAKLTRN